MKTILLTLVCILGVSANATSLHPDTAKAGECRAAATEIAKMNMDQKAKAYLFDSSDVGETVFDKSITNDTEKLYVYNVDAFIYRGNYNVEVTVDSSCAVDSVKITEILRDSTAIPE
ncbi:MAG: hypothetical protein ABL930_01150 [Pseudobdellovibrio sp.]